MCFILADVVAKLHAGNVQCCLPSGNFVEACIEWNHELLLHLRTSKAEMS